MNEKNHLHTCHWLNFKLDWSHWTNHFTTFEHCYISGISLTHGNYQCGYLPKELALKRGERKQIVFWTNEEYDDPPTTTEKMETTTKSDWTETTTHEGQSEVRKKNWKDYDFLKTEIIKWLVALLTNNKSDEVDTVRARYDHPLE